MKVAPIHKAFEKQSAISGQQSRQEAGQAVKHLICHTGQHYYGKMSKVFFEDLELPKPDYYLGVGSGSHAVQTVKVMIEFEKVLIEEKPQLSLDEIIAATKATFKAIQSLEKKQLVEV